MRRPQLSIRTRLWLTLVVAAFLGGIAVQRRLDMPQESAVSVYPLIGPAKLITLPDGTKILQQVFEPIEIDEYEAMLSEAGHQPSPQP
ncbi:MAG TPA: hypothetical protein VGN42_18455 [Pirellulales bacterium]|jgi:hypothetical protein|nr:hypothetical protein [Pirellulales bacterium]